MNYYETQNLVRVVDALIAQGENAQREPDYEVVKGFEPVSNMPPAIHGRTQGSGMKSLLTQKLQEHQAIEESKRAIEALSAEYLVTYKEKPNALILFRATLDPQTPPLDWTSEKVEHAINAIDQIYKQVVSECTALKELLLAQEAASDKSLSGEIDARIDQLIDHFDKEYVTRYSLNPAPLREIADQWKEKTGNEGIEGDYANKMYMIAITACKKIESAFRSNIEDAVSTSILVDSHPV